MQIQYINKDMLDLLLNELFHAVKQNESPLKIFRPVLVLIINRILRY